MNEPTTHIHGSGLVSNIDTTYDIPAEDRRVTLMQDHLYRTSVTHMAMGYGDNPPLTSCYIN